MFVRVGAIALNTFREAVRARVLLGVFAVGLATCAYSLVIAALSLHNESRVVADLGSASVSLYGVLVAIVLGSTSLYRELEHKTVFPILSRPIRRWEYLLGKYAGAVLTVAVFIALEAAAVFFLLALEAGAAPWRLGAAVLGLAAVLALALLRARQGRVFLTIPWAALVVGVAFSVAWPALEERRLIAASAALALAEVVVVSAVATLFASFSSPFLTAAFTAMVFVIGRSADTLAHMPKRQFGEPVARVAALLSHVVPNLHTYVPARPLLLGQVAAHPVWPYVATASLQAICYAAALLVVASLAFQNRDFT